MTARLYYLYIPLLFAMFLHTILKRAAHYPRSYTIYSDAEGYYAYLPAIFILKDIHKLEAGSVLPILNENGEHVNKYTCGVALMEAPFFLIAKWYCQITGNGDWKDYYNRQYMRAMAFSGYFYGFLGLFVLAAALRRKFSEGIVFWTVLSVFLGTNLFHYITRQMSMSHAYSFCVFASILYLTPGLFEKATVRRFVAIGALCGLGVVIRPTNISILIFLFLYGVYTYKHLRERMYFLFRSWYKILCALAAACLVCIPQFLYWYEMTGHFLRYSYVDEGFIYWTRPKILAVLFDTQNGLFLYSPMALLMVAGIIIGIRSKEYHAPALAVIFCAITYTFASWWAWWFGGAFGHRSYVEYYALFAVPLAGLYKHVMAHRSRILKTGGIFITAFLMFYGVKMARLYSHLPGPWDGQDWRWNPHKIEWVWSHLFKPIR